MKNLENQNSAPVQADYKKTSSLIKKMLLEKFGIKTKVSQGRGTSSAIHISYELGANEKDVESFLRLEKGHFNGMEDIYEYDSNHKNMVYDGFELRSFSYCFVNQNISNEMNKKMNEMALELAPSNMTNYEKDTYMNRHFRIRNFVTQNESEITLIKAFFNYDSQDIEFIYEVNGVQYSTRSLEPIAPASKTIEEAKSGIAEEAEKMVQMFAKMDLEQKGEISESVKECARVQGVQLEESAPVNEDVVQLVDYSEKAFAVIGLGTKKIKEDLMKLYGKYNRNLKCGPGYIFSKKHLEKVTEFLNSKK